MATIARSLDRRTQDALAPAFVDSLLPTWQRATSFSWRRSSCAGCGAEGGRRNTGVRKLGARKQSDWKQGAKKQGGWKQDDRKQGDWKKGGRSLMSRRGSGRHVPEQTFSEFEQPATHRGTTGRGKKDHFHLLDRYIRRIDAVLPEHMEHLVRPLGYRPNQEYSTRTLKLTLQPRTDSHSTEATPLTEDSDSTEQFHKEDLDSTDEPAGSNITVEDVHQFFSPIVPEDVVLGWTGHDGETEIYAYFLTNEDCREARNKDAQHLCGIPVKARYSIDLKWEKIKRRRSAPAMADAVG